MTAPVATSHVQWTHDPDVPPTSPDYGKRFVVVRVTTTVEHLGGPFGSVRAAERFLDAQAGALRLVAL